MRSRPMHALVCCALLVACGSGGGSPPLASSVCDLPQHVQRLVSVRASIGIDASGLAVLSDPQCASVHVELRFTQVAARAGLADRLQSALQTAGNTVLTAQLSGVYTRDGGSVFTAESMTGLPPPPSR